MHLGIFIHPDLKLIRVIGLDLRNIWNFQFVLRITKLFVLQTWNVRYTLFRMWTYAPWYFHPSNLKFDKVMGPELGTWQIGVWGHVSYGLFVLDGYWCIFWQSWQMVWGHLFLWQNLASSFRQCMYEFKYYNGFKEFNEVKAKIFLIVILFEIKISQKHFHVICYIGYQHVICVCYLPKLSRRARHSYP